MTSIGNKLPFVSFVVTTYNSQYTIRECLDCLMALDYPRDRFEVITVDDGSADETISILDKYPVKLIRKAHGGYPSAMNAGLKVADGEVRVIVDADTYVEKPWLTKILEEFRDDKVGIVSGYVATKPNAKFWAKIIGFESEDRYDQMKSKYVDFITSTSTAYRREVFEQVGFFNEALKRGSDEDLAQRASKAGWKIVLKKEALCYHDWSSSVKRYFRKQMANTIYEIDNFSRHPELLRGREQHPPSLYVPMFLTGLIFLTPLWLLLSFVWISLLAFLVLILYHARQTVRIIRKHRDWTMLLFPIVFNLRYVAWLTGLVMGLFRLVRHK